MPQTLLNMLTDNIIWIGSFPHSNTQGFWNHQLFLPVEFSDLGPSSTMVIRISTMWHFIMWHLHRHTLSSAAVGIYMPCESCFLSCFSIAGTILSFLFPPELSVVESIVFNWWTWEQLNNFLNNKTRLQATGCNNKQLVCPETLVAQSNPSGILIICLLLQFQDDEASQSTFTSSSVKLKKDGNKICHRLACPRRCKDQWDKIFKGILTLPNGRPINTW